MKDLAYFGVQNILTVPDTVKKSTDVNLEQLLEEGEKAAENARKVAEEKIREFGERALEFSYENNYSNYTNLKGQVGELQALSFEDL